MDAALILGSLRAKAGLSLRKLATRAATSHATLSAYEQGHKEPALSTLERVARASGYVLDLVPSRRFGMAEDRGAELEQVLDLAELFPAEHDSDLRYPVFGR